MSECAPIGCHIFCRFGHFSLMCHRIIYLKTSTKNMAISHCWFHTMLFHPTKEKEKEKQGHWQRQQNGLLHCAGIRFYVSELKAIVLWYEQRASEYIIYGTWSTAIASKRMFLFTLALELEKIIWIKSICCSKPDFQLAAKILWPAAFVRICCAYLQLDIWVNQFSIWIRYPVKPNTLIKYSLMYEYIYSSTLTFKPKWNALKTFR